MEEKEKKELDILDYFPTDEEMPPKKKKKLKWYVWLVIVLVLIILIPLIVYSIREFQRIKLDSLEKTNYLLKVEYGITDIKKEKKRYPKLLKVTKQEHFRYLYILDDYTIYSYYLDSYYDIDPVKGKILDYEDYLKEDTINNILEELKKYETMTNPESDEYLKIRHDRTYYYIKKEDLKNIFKENKITLSF